MLDAYRESVRSSGAALDELIADDGTPRPGWEALVPASWQAEGLRVARGTAARLLEDDGVTYNPVPGTTGHVAGRSSGQWRLDPLPTVVPGEEWQRLERGVAQRARLLEAVVADLYGDRRLLTSGLVPPELVWRPGGYVRPAWGPLAHGRPRVVLAALDLGRAADGSWCVITDRTQAPSGLGYAMENRRVVARLMPETYRGAELRRLTGFFGQVRDALADLAAPGVEDPRVVVLTPGRLSETAFDQAHIASLLGLPLVTGDDLVMREGRLWTRDLGGRRQVDVVLRRVDDTWCDPLELRPDSELGVPGLLEACRRGTVATANGFGAGIVESPAFHPLLPQLCEALLDEPLLLPSAPAWWCGDPLGLSHVLDNLDAMVIRPVSPSHGRGVHGPSLSEAQRERWRARIQRRPGDFVGQEVLPLSTTPTVHGHGLGPRPLTLRTFAVARASGAEGYAVMPGALGRIAPESVDPATGRRERVALSKDVWVLKQPDAVVLATPPEALPVRPTVVPMVPRALENLFWMGRYTERVESATRHVLVLRALVDEFPHGRRDPGRGAVDVVARALTLTTGTGPGLASGAELPDADIDAELRALFLDPTRPGSVAQSLDALAGAAGSVRDQLSSDVFTVLGAMERACQRARDGAVLETGVDVLSGALALAGIASENMVRDVGWQLLDVGRGLERALQTLALTRWVVGDVHPPAVERHLVRAALTAGESVVTHRRRYAGREGVESMIELMLLDPDNPRSVAFQLRRVREALERVPGPAVAQVRALLDEAEADLHARAAAALATPLPRLTGTEALFTEHRVEVTALGERMQTRLHDVARVVGDAWFRHPAAPRALGSVLSFDVREPEADAEEVAG